MHRSSDSIAAIASALAKAQTALVNPEKTMTATIRDDRRGQGAERSFRYAPLSAGLDLVRKALGQHEIAVIQTTALDEATRTLRLNTLLAHSSGEWIASDWPVCALSDMNTPQRMGAALTYARRYGLFTLVGIAGEDDLDAPDLDVTKPGSSITATSTAGPTTTSNAANGRARTGPARTAAPRPILAIDESARLRAAMLAEVVSLSSSVTATSWAQTMLPAKNTLTADDARTVESAFEIKFAELSADLVIDHATLEPAPTVAAPGGQSATPDRSTAKSSTAKGSPTRHKFPLTKTVRHRNKEHLAFVRAQPCLICAKQPSDPHHLPFAQPRALGRKVSDEYAVPLCRAHHRELHRAGKELSWWQSRGIAPLAVAEELWQRSRSGEALNGSPASAANPTQMQSHRTVAEQGAK